MYGELLGKSWKIVWRKRYLWLLGFLAALGAPGSYGGFPSSSSAGNFSDVGSEIGTDEIDLSELDAAWSGLESLVDVGDVLQMALLIGAMVCLVVLIVRFIFWLIGTNARAAMIVGVTDEHFGRTSSLRQAWRAGRPHVWRLIRFRLILIIPVLIFTFGLLFSILVGLAQLSSAISPATFTIPPTLLALAPFTFILSCLLWIPAALIVPFVDAFGYRGIVLRSQTVGQGLRHGWQLFIENAGDSFIFGVVWQVMAFLYGMVMFFVVLLPLVGVGFATGFYGALFDGRLDSFANFIPIVAVVALIALIAMLMSSILLAWRSALFTLVYHEFASDESFLNDSEPASDGPSDAVEKSPDDVDPFK